MRMILTAPGLKRAPGTDFARVSDWKLKRISEKVSGKTLAVRTEGSYQSGPALVLEYEIDSAGFDVSYTIQPSDNTGLYGYIGIELPLADDIDTISWQRRALWSTYPSTHIGRPAGTACRKIIHPEPHIDTKPSWPFSEDSHDYRIFRGGGSYNAPIDFLATREDVIQFTAESAGGGTGISVVENSDAATHCQTVVGDDAAVTLRAYNRINYKYLGKQWGNYWKKGHPAGRQYSGRVVFRYTMP